ncbi:aminoglycoside phosphotransferase family enzyme/predicted kinase [Duganella sp. 1411]|uniref:bifunctional aminoglycoside phosphotransferase/ATP-binding protein n=1 Tax=Duganella sp. 1411 TaxID=2806572 RepID=UPI001AE7278F|nr:bifunctional aminoglycoside phosphotransferase/ATP-binding protein [Duganella sp. 1411]MBP1202068.1 aminoglycoside phosphotransferase family enzyme/predicted kinase [Duganella sp. 1411]
MLSGGAPVARQRRMVAALAERLRGELVETHISWVLLAGEHAYKFKKALRNSWLDYGDAAARRRCCEEELRLNGRLAPGLYLGLATVTGDARRPRLDGAGVALDYAVHMRRFDQRALWTSRLADGVLGADEARRFGAALADFHAGAARAPAGAPWGGAAAIGARSGADLAELGALLAPASPARATLAALAAWLDAARRRLAGRFARRRAGGWVRECHGDLHCGNIVTLADRVLAFDGIEFNPALRWTDVQQDLAFVCMDLQCHGRDDLAARLLDAYLQRGGDYDGAVLLPYYRCQRALVRAKVALLRGGQAEAQRYLAWALRATVPAPPLLVATRGLAGSGKSTLCDSLVEPLAAVRVRSDVERKRRHGLAPGERAGAAPGAGLYTERADRLTYGWLLRLACRVAAAGAPVLLDAGFPRRWQRRRLWRLARLLRARWLLLDVRAAPATLAARLAARAGDPAEPSDAGVELLAYQRRMRQPLLPGERAHALAGDAGAGWNVARAVALAAAIRARTAGPA